MWTEDKIKELCIKYCNKCGVAFDVPIIINKRLTATLGRCTSVYIDSKLKPEKIEFSYQLLKNATDESIKNVIAHECAHYVCIYLTEEKHNHDEIFKYYCKKIGTNNNTTQYNNLQYTKPYEEIYKYTFYCSKCGNFVAGKSKACTITKEPENFISRCCKAKLKMTQNW